MLCAELERLEAELVDIIIALEDPTLPPDRRVRLEKQYAGLSKVIAQHQATGHDGGPCAEDNYPQAE